MENLNTQKLEVIDFFAEWCGPCKMLTPIINQLKEEYSDSETVEISKIDVDSEKEFAQKFGVRSIPTIIFKRGEEVLFKINGACSKKTITDKIEEYLNV